MDPLSNIEQALKNQSPQPPLEKWQPPISGDIDIIICANGDWLHEGDKIQRPQLVSLFASILRREEDNQYYLVTPVEKWRITVEELPLQIVMMDIENSCTEKQSILFTSNVGRKYLLGRNYSLQVDYKETTAEPFPYVTLDYGLQAKINRSVFYSLVDVAEEAGNELVIVSDGVKFSLGSVE